ncbi:PIN domain-containing protein [Streptomyces sp. CA-252508]|uniref:PIN domain-containing protein n=1 Tax=Streptomyces sp. CA-252508 TaxID=3418946 RepID=UPI003D8AC8B4
MLTLLPGTHRDNVLMALQSVHTEASSVRGAGPMPAYSRLLGYLDWSSNAVRMLHNQISVADIDRLVLTRRHQALLDGFGHLAGSQQERVVNGLVNLELDQRLADIKEAIDTLRTQMERWNSKSTAFIVADTSYYLEHPSKLEDIDFAAEFKRVGGRDVRVVFPMVVVDELDSLKQHKDRRIRWRAGYTLAVLDRLLADGEHADLSKGDDEPGSPAVTVEVLYDPPGHVRLPIADDEIVSRALAFQALVGSRVTVVTYDTAMSMRARATGLSVKKLRTDAGEGPEPTKQ